MHRERNLFFDSCKEKVFFALFDFFFGFPSDLFLTRSKFSICPFALTIATLKVTGNSVMQQKSLFIAATGMVLIISPFLSTAVTKNTPNFTTVVVIGALMKSLHTQVAMHALVMRNKDVSLLAGEKNIIGNLRNATSSSGMLRYFALF